MTLSRANLFFTDGACSGNPGAGGWAFVGYLRQANCVFESAGSAPDTTNNQMELEAVCRALEFVLQKNVQGEILILSDSNYVIQGISSWIFNWKRNNWKKSDGQDVLNRSWWERLDALSQSLSTRLKWRYVPGHSDVVGNNRADELAVKAAQQEVYECFDGPLTAYHLDLFAGLDSDGAASASKKAKAKKRSAKKGAYYLSLVDGQIERHTTWADCEALVKGRSNAKFKKVADQNEEKIALEKWGVS